MPVDALLLSRLQFAFTIGFHILWPAYTIGIASFIAILNTLWHTTRRPVYQQLMRFWIRIFALGFAMGVVTGLVLSYQIGTNWSGFASSTSNVVGPLFMYEVMSAFFLEAGFIGILLVGEGRVHPKLHLFASWMVAFGTVFSAFWILVANSWMQTPAGYAMDANGIFHVTNWVAAIFNPSLPYRFAHMVIACYLTGTLIVGGVSAYYLLRGEYEVFARKGFSMALWAAVILAPLQMVAGDAHGLNTREHQPMKLAAIEGRWETGSSVPLTIFAIPNQEQERNEFAIEIPVLGSLILTHSLHGTVEGLKEVPSEDRPTVIIVFFAFRVMVGVGLLLLSIALVGAYLRWRGRLYTTRWFAKIVLCATPLGFVAILAGWVVTEAGRQPYLVYGKLRTADAVSSVSAGSVGISLALFFLVYNVLLLSFFWYGWRAVRRGPPPLDTGLPDRRPLPGRITAVPVAASQPV